MLEELRVCNYALIEDITIRFDDGFNVLTGETGAGKSILIEALGLVLGARASTTHIRQGADQCTVTAVFSLEHTAGIEEYLAPIGLFSENHCIILRREVSSSGKSRCYINDHPVNLGTLCNVGEFLVDLHGQHEHQSLLKVSEQREMLDRFGALEGKREVFRELYNQYMDLIAQREAMNVNEQERMRRIDLYKFQWEEIEKAKLEMNEDEEIETLLPRLKHADKLSHLVSQAYECLYSADSSIRDQLLKLNDRLRSINQLVGDFKDSISVIDEISISLEELTENIERFRQSLEHDPGLLDTLLSRQDVIDKLRKKYGETIAEIKDFQARVKQELDHLEHLDEKTEEITRQIHSRKEALVTAGKELSLLRKKAASQLASLVEKELKKLGMPRVSFTIVVNQHTDEQGNLEMSTSGLDQIEFLFSVNPGEKPMPLRQVASGGEISRIMLALKSAVAQVDRIPTLIFDEIDAGVGGSMGGVIGERLDFLSKLRQVIVITHLPQIASFAHAHYHVDKEVSQNRTRTIIERLFSEQRKEEIAAMLGGKSKTRVSLKYAEEMLKQAKK